MAPKKIDPWLALQNIAAHAKVFKPIRRSGPREAQRLLNAGLALFRQPNS
jgi:hypothetical protein